MITPEFEEWYVQNFNGKANQDAVKAQLEAMKRRNGQLPTAPSVKPAGVNSSTKAITTGSASLKARRVLRVVLATLAALTVWEIVIALMRLVIVLLGQLPLLSFIIYAPMGASWALIALPGPTAVMCGGFCSSAIAKTAKPFVSIVLLTHLILVLAALVSNGPWIRELLDAVFSGVAAILCWPMNGTDDV